MPDWAWTHPVFSLDFDAKGRKIVDVVIDARGLLADIDKTNIIWDKDRNMPDKP